MTVNILMDQKTPHGDDIVRIFVSLAAEEQLSTRQAVFWLNQIRNAYTGGSVYLVWGSLGEKTGNLLNADKMQVFDHIGSPGHG